MGLEVSNKEVVELVDDHKTKLTIEELQHLHIQQQEEVEAKSRISNAKIEKLLYLN